MREAPQASAAAPGTTLVDLLDRVVHRGAVVSGDVVISLAGIDLLRLDLRLLLIGIESSLGRREVSTPARTVPEVPRGRTAPSPALPPGRSAGSPAIPDRSEAWR